MNRERNFIEHLASSVKECSPIATEGVHGHKGVLHEDIVLESEFEGERVKFLTFLEKRETSTGFE